MTRIPFTLPFEESSHFSKEKTDAQRSVVTGQVKGRWDAKANLTGSSSHCPGASLSLHYLGSGTFTLSGVTVVLFLIFFSVKLAVLDQVSNTRDSLSLWQGLL
jgi:hypothetical protein